MTKIVSATGLLQPTAHAKLLVAQAMYQKGSAFLASAGLLHQRGGDRYVVLHLLCQGIEIVMKGVLLLVDYDQYRPQLKTLGHDLITTTDTAMKAANLPTFKGEARRELIGLNNLYSKHLLRYASHYDVLVDARSIPFMRTLMRMVALLHRFARKGIPNAKAI